MLVAVCVFLVLTDQAEVAIVHHDHQHGDLVLSGHGQFFRHEQEAGVSHHHHRRVVRVCHFGADSRRQLVAESARASRCQVAPRAVDILQLAGPDLGDAAAGGEDRVGRKEIVDLLKHALRLDGYVFVIGLAGQLSPEFGQALDSLGSRRMVSSPPRFFEQRRQRQFDIRDDAQLHRHHASDLRRFDVDVDELTLAPIYVHLARVPVGEPASETNHQIGVQKVPVPDGLPDLDSGVAGIERVGIRKPALSHVSHDDGQRELLGKLPEFGGRIG